MKQLIANRTNPIASSRRGSKLRIRYGMKGMMMSCGKPIHAITAPDWRAL